MKRLTAITVLCVLFLSAFAAGKGPAGVPGYPDSLRSVWLYTEGIKQNAIARDTVRAREFFVEAIRNDSTFAPAYYEMAANGMYSTPDEAVDLARTPSGSTPPTSGTTSSSGRHSSMPGRYDEALPSTAACAATSRRTPTTTGFWPPSTSRRSSPSRPSPRSTRPRCASGASRY